MKFWLQFVFALLLNILQDFAQWDALAVGHRDITGCTVQAAIQDDRDI